MNLRVRLVPGARCLAPAVLATLQAIAAVTAVAGDRGLDQGSVRRGAELFESNCQVCHQAGAAGAPGWYRRDAQGNFPPPPLNGTAHAWHHDREALARTIVEGTEALGGSMPGWKDRLEPGEVDSLIDWIVSIWPDEVYEVWRDRVEQQ